MNDDGPRAISSDGSAPHDDLSCAVRLAMLAAYQCGRAFGPIPCTSAEEQRSRQWALDALIDAHVRRIQALFSRR